MNETREALEAARSFVEKQHTLARAHTETSYQASELIDQIDRALATLSDERGEERGIRELAARYCYEQARQWRAIPAHDLDGAADKWEKMGDNIVASIVNLLPVLPASIRAGGDNGH